MAQAGPNLAVIRTTQVTSTDRQNVRAWLDAQLSGLIGSDNPLPDSIAFYGELMSHYRASNATPAFREALAELLGEALAAQLTPANRAKAPVPFAMALAALSAFEQPGSAPACTAALQHEDSAVRFAAANCLFRIRDRLPDPVWTNLLPQIAAAGKAARDPVTTARIYELLQVSVPARADQAAPVLGGILDARLERFEQAGTQPTLADARAAGWLSKRAIAANNPAARKEAASRLGRLLADAVHVYTSQTLPDAQKRPIELTVLEAEALLKELVGGTQPPPDVSGALLNGGALQQANMSRQVDLWIGTEQTAGLLNGPPFELPRVLGIKRPTTAAATATAPG